MTASLAIDDAVVLWRTVFDRERKPVATRLMIQPLNEAGDPGSDALVRAISEAWPLEFGPLWLAVTQVRWLEALMRTALPANLLLEIPPFLAEDAAQALPPDADKRFVLSGASRTPLAPDVQRAFALSLTACGENDASGLPHAVQGCDSLDEANAALKAGALGVAGWPLGDPPDGSAKRKEIPAGVAVVMELMQRVDKEEPAAKLEDVIRRDPALAYRLMRYINSPGVGLPVEINSFHHALMLLGYRRLKRWLALLLTGSVGDPDLKPLMHLAVARGLVMEELARHHADPETIGELFICGVFSLLDRMLGQPFDHLLAKLPVPDSVRLALGQGSGPLRPWLDIAIAAEQGTAFELKPALETMLLRPADANRAVLHAMRTARQMQTD